MNEWVPKNDHITYLEVKHPTLLTDFLKSETPLLHARIMELLSLGAIHINNKRAEQDLLLKKGDLLRVHLYPKRYPVEEVDWSKVLVHETDEYVVLNKPAKIPVPPTVDNLHDNVLNAFSKYLKIPLHITQRLDRGTTGLLFFAKTKEFQSEYNKLLLDNKITKKYLALTEKKVPTGMHTHYISDTTKIPKQVIQEAKKGFKEAKLIVKTCTPLSYQGKNYFQSSIQLLTGRTHQIRAQFAELQCPLLGDRTYGGKEVAGFTFESFALHAYEVSFLHTHYSVPPIWR